MPHYIIKTTISVDVEMEVESANIETARDIFRDQIAANVCLVGDAKFSTCDDSISEMGQIEISEI